MHLIESPTELTTSVTDALLAIECVVIVVWLLRNSATERWRTRLWSWAFGILGLASLLGALAHGLAMPPSVRAAIWKPLYLCLGIVVGLFVVGAIADWRGQRIGQRLVPWAVAVGALFFAVTQLSSGAFILFVLYEAVAMLAALVIYSLLAGSCRLPGAGLIALAILLNLVAAAVQASSLSWQLLVPFDHNGLFHLVQMLSLAALAWGLRLGTQSHDTQNQSLLIKI
jgi:hypothetical protein